MDIWDMGWVDRIATAATGRKKMFGSIFILIMVLVAASLIFGCISQKQGNVTVTEGNATKNTLENRSGIAQAYGQTQNQSQNQQSATEAQSQEQKINTSGISFFRNASDVMNSNTTIPVRQTYDFSNITTAEGKLIVYFFYSPKCVACKAIIPEIDKLEAKYPEVAFLRYDITTQNGTNAYQDFADSHNLSRAQRMVPQVLVNDTIITDRFRINDTLEDIIVSFGTS